MRQSAWSSLVDGVEAEAFFGVHFLGERGIVVVVYLLIAGDFAFLRSLVVLLLLLAFSAL